MILLILYSITITNCFQKYTHLSSFEYLIKLWLPFGRKELTNIYSVEVVRIEEFLTFQFENSWLLATVGSKKQKEMLDGLSATNQNFLCSGNARPLPGILLEANNPLKISNTFGLDWGIGHYELNDNRFVNGTHVHYKRLALITTFNENHCANIQKA